MHLNVWNSTSEFYFRSALNSEGRETRISKQEASFPAVLHQTLLKNCYERSQSDI